MASCSLWAPFDICCRFLLACDSRGGVSLHDLHRFKRKSSANGARLREDGTELAGSSSDPPSSSGSACIARYSQNRPSANKAPILSSDLPLLPTSGASTVPTTNLSAQVQGHTASASCVAWYPHDTGLFVTGGFDSRLIAWDTNRFTPAFAFGLDGRVFDCAMSPIATGHSLVAVAASDSRVRLADLSTCGFTHALVGHSDAVVCLQWSNVSDWVLATGSRDGSIRLWDIRKAGQGSVAQIASCDAGATTLTAAKQLSNAAAASAVAAASNSSKGIVGAADPLRAARAALSQSLRGGQGSSSYPSSSASSSSSNVSGSRPLAHPGGVNGVCFLPSSSSSAAAGGGFGSLAPGLPLWFQHPSSGSSTRSSVAITPAELLGYGAALFTAGADSALRRWHLQMISALSVASQHSGSGGSSSSSSGNKPFFSDAISSSIPGFGGDCASSSSSSSSESNYAATVLNASVPFPACPNRYRHKLRLAASALDGKGGGVVFYPSTSSADDTSGGAVLVLDAATGETLASLQAHHSSVNACAWSHASQTLVSAGDDGLVLAWGARTLLQGR